MVLQPNLVSCCATFLCTNRITRLRFMTFTLWQKEGKKTKETLVIFEDSYLRNGWHNLVKFLNVRWWHWLVFPLQKSSSFVKASQSYVYTKITLLFFLLITHGCGVLTSWATLHTTICLDLIQSSPAVKKCGTPRRLLWKKDVKSKVVAKKWLRW